MASSSDRRSGSSGRSRKDKAAPRSKERGRRRAPARRTSTPHGPKGTRIAAEKRAARERRLAERRRAVRKRLVLWAAAALLLLVGLIALYDSSLFTVERIEVTGNERLTADEVRVLARLPEDATLLRFPADEVRERIEADPWVAAASVSRDFPDTMLIRVEEREPAALVDLGEEYLLVDGDGYVIEYQSLEETTALIVIRDVGDLDSKVGRRSTSEGLHNALLILAGLSPEMRAKVRAISVASIDETALLTTDGVEIFFGVAEDISKKDLVAREILEEQVGRVVFIDVRTVDRPIWRGLED